MIHHVGVKEGGETDAQGREKHVSLSQTPLTAYL